MDIPPSLRLLAENQHGLLTRADLRRHGLPRDRRLGLVTRGALVPVRPQVFRVHGAPVTTRQGVLALCLDRGAVASHRTAAWLHGLSSFGPPRRLEVLGQRSKIDAKCPGAIVHTTTWLPAQDIVDVGGIPTLAVARTIMTLCSLVPRDVPWLTVKNAMDQACRDGLADDPWLWWRLEKLRRSGRNGVRVMEEMLSLRRSGDVTESWLEAATMALFRRSGIPLPRCQARVEQRGAFVARVDFAFDDANLVIEVAGHRPHKTRDQAQRDAERARQLILAGYTVLTFTYDDVVRFPERMTAEVREALRMRLAA